MDEREREIRRRRSRRQMIIKKRRRRRRILLTGLCILLLLLIVGLSACFKMCGSDNQEDRISEENEGEHSSSEVKDSGDEDYEQESLEPSGEDSLEESKDHQSRLLSLGAADIYKGDLILVNTMYEYHFEQNASQIQLTGLDTYNDGAIKAGKEGLQLAGRILEPLYRMISDCNAELGVDNTGVTSAYRTREYQENVYNQYVEAGGVEYAEAYVSDPGFSEHHTGLSLDMGIYYHDGSEGQFTDSNNAAWMDEHCQEYGFIRRYKEDKVSITGIKNEAWHFRYVGVPHATYMNANNLCMEEYIGFLRNSTSKESPVTITCSTGTYLVYATKERNMVEPEGEYTISGDNIDGYIVTETVTQ